MAPSRSIKTLANVLAGCWIDNNLSFGKCQGKVFGKLVDMMKKDCKIRKILNLKGAICEDHRKRMHEKLTVLIGQRLNEITASKKMDRPRNFGAYWHT